MAAGRAGESQWGLSGPHDAGHYNLQPQQSGFFHHQKGSWDSDYGRFFLTVSLGLRTQPSCMLPVREITASHCCNSLLQFSQPLMLRVEGRLSVPCKCWGPSGSTFAAPPLRVQSHPTTLGQFCFAADSVSCSCTARLLLLLLTCSGTRMRWWRTRSACWLPQ